MTRTPTWSCTTPGRQPGSRSVSRPRGARALTLLEILAVVLIVALVAGAIAVNVASVRGAVALDEAAAACRHLDRLGRLHARRGRAIVLGMADGGRAMELRTARSDEVIARAKMPSGVSALIEPSGPRTLIAFDRSGAGPDYRLRLVAEGRRAAWRTCGVTGHIIELEAEP